MTSISNPEKQPGFTNGSAARAQNLNVQYGKIFGIFGIESHVSKYACRCKRPFWQTSNKMGCSEPVIQIEIE